MNKIVLTASAAALGAAALSLVPTAASAQGDWSGFHVDGHVDAGWMRTDWSGFDGAEGFFTDSEVSRLAPTLPDETVVDFRAKHRDTGWGGGVGLGYNFQFDNIVLGGIADWTWLHASDSSSFAGAEGGTVTLNSKVESFGTLRAVLGFAGERVMPYVTAGWAWGDVKRHLHANHQDLWSDSIDINLDADDGWTAGGGINFALSPSTSINAEVLYLDFGSDSRQITHENIEAAAEADTHMTVARIGIQFRL